MTKLPKRPRKHILETASEIFIKNIFPDEWLLEFGKYDYGVDLVVEIVKENNVTGAHFILQLKATDVLKIRRSEYISYQLKTSTLNYFLERQELVVLIIYDANENIGYWIWIQDYIRNSLKKGWRERKTATIRIPVKNKFDLHAIKDIERRVLSVHEQSKWVTAVQTSQNPYFGYRVTVDNKSEVKVVAYEKYPGALLDRPVVVNLVFNFDDSPESQSTRQALEESYKKGTVAKIDGRFIKDFDFSEIAPELFSQSGKFTPTEIEISSAKNNEGFPAKFTILDANRQALAEIPYIDFRVIQAGTEEITLSNEHQAIPLKIYWTLDSQKQTSSYKFRIELTGVNISQIKDFSQFVRSVRNGREFQITNLSNGNSVKEDLPSGIDTGLDDQFFEIIEDLLFIQTKTGQIIRFPEKITYRDIQYIKKIVEIISTGKTETRISEFHFTLSKQVALNLVKVYDQNERMALRFDNPGSKFQLFEQILSLGPTKMVLPNAALKPETKKMLSGLDKLSDETIVELSLVLGKRGIITYYPDWIPK